MFYVYYVFIFINFLIISIKILFLIKFSLGSEQEPFKVRTNNIYRCPDTSASHTEYFRLGTCRQWWKKHSNTGHRESTDKQTEYTLVK